MRCDIHSRKVCPKSWSIVNHALAWSTLVMLVKRRDKASNARAGSVLGCMVRSRMMSR